MKSFLSSAHFLIFLLFWSCLQQEVLAQNEPAKRDTAKSPIDTIDLSGLELVSPDNGALKIYRAAATKINDLVHTKLDVKFDYKKKYLYGQAWITLHPHFYATDTLTLDAKGMDILQVALFENGKKKNLPYRYDGMELHIQLGKTYQKDEKYTVYINYVAKPNELKVKGSAAITDAKGLYFINPDGRNPNKPIQIWTQGETESSSVWFPTIDKSNQKTTAEIAITVQNKYVTLSNGRLASQHKNADGTRTDTWKMEQPHSPYLFMMAVGDFAIVRDKWRNKPVNYYVEKKFAPYAKQIFGNTPEMMEFFSKKLGVDFPWLKYSQIVVRDYVSGAMENTTATLHGDFLQKTDRELLDNNHEDEDVISHELFHQWFGDLVTCESWSNLTLNESFADFGEMLWREHKYGEDAADAHSYSAMQNYLQAAEFGDDPPLVRFHYRDKEDMFDAVSYQKGGRILNMLRHYVGEEAFFKSLNLYLRTNAYKSAEAHQLRLAFEEVTGQDLNWFWNQWYFGRGYPVLDIDYSYDDVNKKISVIVKQTQDGAQLFRLPMAVDIYEGGKRKRKQIIVENKIDTFTFAYTLKPDLVNVDAEKITLAKKTDHKSLDNLIYQYKHAPLYLDRREALEACLKQQTTNAGAKAIVIAALKDKYDGLRNMAIAGVDLSNAAVRGAAVPLLIAIAKNDPVTTVRATALKQLGKLKDTAYLWLFKNAVRDRSYAVSGAALSALAALNLEEAYTMAKQMEKEARGALVEGIATVYAEKGNENDVAFFAKRFEQETGFEKISAAALYLNMLAQIKNNEIVRKAIDQIKTVTLQFHNTQLNNYMISMLNAITLEKKKQANAANDESLKKSLTEQIDCINKAMKEIKEAKTAQ